MPNESALLAHVKTHILAQEWPSLFGIEAKQVYVQNLPAVKDPVYPCITLGYEVDAQETTMDVDKITLFVGFHDKTFGNINQVVTKLKEALHTNLPSSDNVIIYRCFGGPTGITPGFNSQLNCWESYLEFSIWFTDAPAT